MNVELGLCESVFVSVKAQVVGKSLPQGFAHVQKIRFSVVSVTKNKGVFFNICFKNKIKSCIFTSLKNAFCNLLSSKTVFNGVKMKIFAIMLVKNEADVVKYSILDAKRWADRIFVMDNGSTDGTWQIVQSFADEIVVPWKQDPQPFYDGLRADVFNHFRHEAQEGDWWCCNFDADEFYLDNPKEFLSKVPKEYGLVAKKSLNFVLTQEDIKNYEFTGDFEKDRSHINKIGNCTTIEQRFFRYKKSFRWDNKNPFHTTRYAGKLYPKYILLKHYNWRSPQQMESRIATRRTALQFYGRNGGFRVYPQNKTWQDFLCKPENCVLADSDTLLRKLADELPYWSAFGVPLRRRIVNRLKLYFTLGVARMKNKTN